jgi:hypothetical protein
LFFFDFGLKGLKNLKNLTFSGHEIDPGFPSVVIYEYYKIP